MLVDIGCFQEIVNHLFLELLLDFDHLFTNLGHNRHVLPLHIEDVHPLEVGSQGYQLLGPESVKLVGKAGEGVGAVKLLLGSEAVLDGVEVDQVEQLGYAEDGAVVLVPGQNLGNLVGDDGAVGLVLEVDHFEVP